MSFDVHGYATLHFVCAAHPDQEATVTVNADKDTVSARVQHPGGVGLLLKGGKLWVDLKPQQVH